MHHYVVVVVIVFLIAQSNARELRPSDHGLYYEEDSLPPAQSDAAMDMRSFFGKATSSNNVPLPEAKDIGDTWWNVHKEGKSRDTKISHVRVGLMVASMVCGLTGIVLLVVSGVVFLFRLQKKKSGSNSCSSSSKDEKLTANKSEESGSLDVISSEVSGDKK